MQNAGYAECRKNTGSAERRENAGGPEERRVASEDGKEKSEERRKIRRTPRREDV